MKKIILLFALLMFFSNCFSQNSNSTRTIKIYDTDSASVWVFYKINTPQTGYKNLYIQLKGMNEGNYIDSRYGNIYRLNYQTSVFSDNIHHNFLKNGFDLTPYGLCVGYKYDFNISRRDTSLLISGGCAAWWEPMEGALFSPNNGDTVRAIFTNVFQGYFITVAIDPINDSIMYAGLNSGLNAANFYKTTNRGNNWFATDTLSFYPRSRTYVSPFNHNILFLMNSSLYRSTTGGYDFSVNTTGTSFDGKILFDSTDNATYLISPTTEGIRKSTNNGNNWTQIFNKPSNDLEIDPLNSDIFYAGTGEGIYKSTNKGSSWFLYNNSFSPSKKVIGIIKNPNTGDTLYTATEKGVYKVFGAALIDTSSVKYFPMATGNVYTYYYNDFYNTYYSKGRITKDSLMYGHIYYYCIGIPGVSTGWTRVDSVSGLLLQLSPGSGCGNNINDKIIDSLAARRGDSLNYCPNAGTMKRVCSDTSNITLFGNYITKQKSFSHDGLIVSAYTYAKNIGIVSFGSAEPPPIMGGYSIKGCKVNGVVYGDTNAYYSVSGNIFYSDNNQPATGGYVKVIKLNRETGAIITFDSAQIQLNGAYTLVHVPQDSVDIGVYPNSNTQNDWVVTYYPSTIYWKSAAVLYPTGNLTNINIGVKRLVSTSNPNSINGLVLKMTNSPYSNIKDAILYAKSGETFLRCGISDVNGVYHLPSLPAGNIKVIVDRIGYNGDSTNVYLTSTSNPDSINFFLSRFSSSVNRVESSVPTEYKLFQNYPNPFNPATVIKFQIKDSRFVTLKIYDVLGKVVSTLVNGNYKPGTYEATFDGGSLPSGIYFYKLQAGEFSEVKKMVLIK